MRAPAYGRRAAAGGCLPRPEENPAGRRGVFVGLLGAGAAALWMTRDEPSARAVPGSPTPAGTASAAAGSAGGMPADHPPLELPAEARAFLEHVPVSAADRERIAHGNAERLFGL